MLFDSRSRRICKAGMIEYNHDICTFSFSSSSLVIGPKPMKMFNFQYKRDTKTADLD